jgi:heme/copper-type cytochrome/quinol oxidase subunit 2
MRRINRHLATLASPVWWLAAGLTVAVLAASAAVAQSTREIAVTGRKYTYVVEGASGPEITVRQNDMVSITFSADDIAHSFTISDDLYRIDKRAQPGKPVTFRFLASKAGQFEFRCVLTIDERCQREMRGRLVVTAK